MDINHISVSRKQCFDLCKAQYKFKYHDKIIIDGPEEPYFLYGKIVHKVAEEYVRGKGKKKIENVAKDLFSGKILLEEGGSKPVLDPIYKNKFPQHLQVIKNFTDRVGFDGELEWNFRFDLDPPHERFVTGFIDRLIIRDNKYFIVDYKTTKKGGWRKNPSTIRQDIQLRSYAKVVQTTFNAEAKDIKACLLYVDGGDVIPTSFTQASLDAVQKELVETHRAIQEMPPDKIWGSVGEHCCRCPFVLMCPYYSLTRK